MNRKGQIGLFPLLGTAATIIIVSIGAFFTQANRIGGVETRAAVLEVRYENIDKKLERIEGKLDSMFSKDFRIGGFASSSVNGHK